MLGLAALLCWPAQPTKSLAAAQLAIAMLPGPNTVLVLQCAMHERKLGFMAAVGIWPASLILAAVGIGGLGAILSASPVFAMIMPLICGAYLLWLGVKSAQRSFQPKGSQADVPARKLSGREVFISGISTQITNPKAIAYFASIFAATGVSLLPVSYQVLTVIMMATISFLWYSSLVVLVSYASVRQVMENSRHWLDRIAGLVMCGFGIKLFASVLM